MTRVKRGTTANKRREAVLKHAKGFKWGRKSKERSAKDALYHAWSYAFVGRKLKKREYRRLWQTRIDAGVRPHGLSYSRFIHALKQKKIELDRKVLSELAVNYPEVFQKIVSAVK
ncbi:MAG: 50S ribosomal protein L20 [Candidatus Sungbacteria bacterium RIFCSPLOWO2_01_FULL_47_32]|uniref:Large ribosomal subunit protein bL20 n=1 Tax=Candidatus Sungbacteria bacterium RIFCSPHIGHO2_01_FULL_47_32 TaxID=1802264 RepID=A0A1G2K1Y0_9BACT|nr:MAG: 50S ribosomal protein L20 [Parcubacteria group bacterium GW2011_GWA2_47_10]OGZ93439.1 MAG: 50S ribosomal protein L20 [Candidatus Sungbacteria bacterium RIFCSPHIGHO2_01_FULL_47_32]OGZ99811.1 MAG: 50S ribosomal protein L20 [Candidatus Sungbacteria bacterium RIFCSPHIGHO2_02_FULL_46_12]OHA05026.1 MAG: 50S ribosomal protein L20 [Candidatus Sungbacteria bacterium RIFCSPLOWO2_01_FULL_47_32]